MKFGYSFHCVVASYLDQSTYDAEEGGLIVGENALSTHSYLS